MKALRFRKRPDLGHFSMYVRGFQLDVIKEVEQVARNGQIPREWAELVRWEDAKGHPPDAFWRTLVANRGKEGKNPPVYYSRACQESFKKGGLESGAVDTTALIDYERNSVVAQFCRRVQAVTWNRALVRTEAGRLALVGKDVEKGDLVCILYGCSVPVVLRGSKRKAPEVFDAEMEHELIDVKNTVVQNFRRYMSRKRRHEARKDIEMASLCRRWFKATDYIHTKGFSSRKLSDEAIKEDLLRILKSAIASFKIWWLEERLKQWSGVKSRMEQEREDAKMKKSKPGKKEMDEILHKQREKQEVEARAHRKRRKSRSAADMLELAPVTTFSVGGAGAGTSKDASLVAKKRKPVIDWWAFEYALAAGRRWKQIVKERRESRAAFAMRNTRVDWINQKRDNYNAFKDLRMREGKWIEVVKAPEDALASNESTQQRVTNGEHATYEQPNGNEKQRYEKTGEPKSGSDTEEDKLAGIEVEHEEDEEPRMNEESQGNDVTGATEGLETDSETSPTSGGPLVWTSNTLPQPSQPPSLEVRPSWANRENKTKLKRRERDKYDEKIRNNLRERLGEEGWFSYKLLGECYIHGVMDGEAMLYQNEGDDKVVPSMVFEIR